VITALDTKTFVLSEDIIQQRVGDRTATYHRLLGGLFFLDDAGQEVLQSFKQKTLVPEAVLRGQASNRQE